MFFPSWEWEGYINTKSQAIDINDITKAEKEQNKGKNGTPQKSVKGNKGKCVMLAFVNN